MKGPDLSVVSYWNILPFNLCLYIYNKLIKKLEEEQNHRYSNF